ncbi:MAG: hypothetical protein J6A07_09980 [Firmicutes bacterium]|nr:hypothetical protein [Bacillota bacterium]
MTDKNKNQQKKKIEFCRFCEKHKIGAVNVSRAVVLSL